MSNPIPPNVLSQHTIALGKTRSGKSSALRFLVEQQLDANRRVCIIDPKGDWFGLKSSANGKHAGYPVVIFGGEHGDVPINDRSGSAVAELIATGNRPSLIDLGGWSVGERTRFYIEFAATLFRTVKAPLLLVIDECHNFVPQGKILDVDAGKMLHWSNRLASEGGGKGIILLAASQRPQKVHKDFVTSMETLLAFRVIHPLDRNAMKDWIDGCQDRERGKEVLESLANMPRGEAWVWSPEIGFGPKRIKFPKFKTFDSFAAPTGEAESALKGWAEVDLDDVRAKLQAVVAEAEANDPKLLRQKIAALEKQIANAKPADDADVTRDKIQARLSAAHAWWQEQWKYAGVGLVDQVSRAIAELNTGHEKAIEAIFRVAMPAAPDAYPANIWASRLNDEKSPDYRVTQVDKNVPRTAHIRSAGPRPSREVVRSATAGNVTGTLDKGSRVILTAIAQHPHGVTREQLTILTGYKRSSRDTFLQRLRAAGMADTGDTITVTEAGMAALGDDFERLPTGDRLREYWLGKLSGGERVIFEVVCRAYPHGVNRTAISEATEYQRSSRDTFLQRLSARKLIVNSRDGVKAADELFGG